ncbi:MAG: hypothetical protein GWM98_13295 [Nitrospinaceae bacterium]|nr:hypothetical protein [Nitrospinaceae bacterium]NIR55266.1 hypothetical protein [Nitrospinaceae bacterium]NIS85704.1 hypothetical protein [Nitrospinaceae bacterium]NIT82555.1 hypothetical protein [Nitrospinaceae bacterium]NIU44759.1 hypothetical protein [Nitrospinaceae bacterium]
MKPEECTLFSGGAQGAESEFGAAAEHVGMQEINFTFDGHQTQRQRGLRHLTQEELLQGDVSLSYVSKLMNRSYSTGPLLKKVLQSIWHQINSAEEVFVVGKIQKDNTVKGGTGWGAEFAKLCNKPLHVFDQDANQWFGWNGEKWEKNNPKIEKQKIAGTGTRFLNDDGKQAIAELFRVSFK